MVGVCVSHWSEIIIIFSAKWGIGCVSTQQCLFCFFYTKLNLNRVQLQKALLKIVSLQNQSDQSYFFLLLFMLKIDLSQLFLQDTGTCNSKGIAQLFLFCIPIKLYFYQQFYIFLELMCTCKKEYYSSPFQNFSFHLT